MYALMLGIQQNEYFDSLAGKRFALLNKGHNILVKHAVHLLNKLNHDVRYQKLREQYQAAEEKSSEAKAAGEALNDYRASIGLSEAGLQSYIKVWQHHYKNHISSQQAQKEATRVYNGVRKIVFGKGKKLHFRKSNDCLTICGKSPKNGVSFDRDSMKFKWINETFSLKPIDPDNTYVLQVLFPNGAEPLPLSYCEIKRMMFSDGWHYYLVLYIKGTAPRKHAVGAGRIGIDPGTSTMAAVAEHGCVLRELAPRTKEYIPKLKKIQKAMDRSRRDSNPDNYNPDGTVKKGSKRWFMTRQYKRLERRLKSTYRKKATYTRQSHYILADEILNGGNNVFVEAMDYKGLQAKSKTTERKTTVEIITTRSGRKKRVFKYRKRKRFGKSLNNRAPSMFLTILEQKATATGGSYTEIDTWSFKASQYDHVTDKCTKATLKQRSKLIGRHEVQRDLYSAFLIQHTDDTLTHPDREACIIDFEAFLAHMSKEINMLKASGQSMPVCFGF